ncbi:MAG: PAS domain S-box protein [Nitrospirota bacterium]|nr:MAG: PAS domain S-box protein [Nitrospirota bacterium]
MVLRGLIKSIRWRLIIYAILLSELITLSISIIRDRYSLELFLFGFFVPLIVAPAMALYSYLMRRRTEQALRDSEARFREMAELLPQPICELDLKGNITYANKLALKSFGYSEEDLSATINVFDLFLPEDKDRAINNFRSRLNNENFDDHEYSMLTKDGRTVPVHVYSSTIIRNGNLAGVRAVINDLSERKMLEEQLIHSQKLETIGTLTAGVSHEFNNILSSIIGYGEMLQDELNINTKAMAYSDRIVFAAKKASKITEGMLSYSRKQITRFDTVNVKTVLKELKSFVSNLVGENIVFNINMPREELYIYADPSQFEQVILNLITNAIDAMPAGGTLTVSADRSSADGSTPLISSDEHAVIKVTDSGMGMDKEIQAKIYEPFFTTKDIGKGTGLGLSVVYGIVKKHNGHINLISEPGKGSSFEVFVPSIKAPFPSEKPASTDSIFRKGTETVLVAEDDPNVRKMIVSALKSAGYSVIEAVDGEAAVRKFEANKEKVDLLVFDFAMPTMDGLEAYKQINDLQNGVKVIFMSGYVLEEGRGKEILDEKYTFIPKPLSPKTLLATVREQLDK